MLNFPGSFQVYVITSSISWPVTPSLYNNLKLVRQHIPCYNEKKNFAKTAFTLSAYEIEITTSDKSDAGMTQNVWVILEGEQRASKEIVLENSAKTKAFRR